MELQEKKPLLFSNKDLKKLIWPLIIEQLLTVLVGMMDTIMVASVGEAGVSAVSLVDSIMILIIQIFAAIATGGAVVAGQFLGAKEEDNACSAANQLVLFIAALSVGVMALVYLLRGFILHQVFGQISPEVMAYCSTYLDIVSLSIPFIALYNGGAALFRTMGNSKISMYTSLLMNAINVVGNAILIYGFKMEVAGAAIPTLFSRIVAAVVMIALLRNPKLLVHLKRPFVLRFNGGLIKRILYIGVPNGLENSMFQLGKILVMSAVATMGTSAIAANAVTGTIANWNNLPGFAINLAIVSVVSVCVGAGRYDQARYYTRRLCRDAMIGISCLSIILYLSAPILVTFFNLGPDAAQLTIQIVRIHAVASAFLWMPAFGVPNTLRAAGDVVWPMSVAIFSMWVFRVVLAYVFTYVCHFGLVSIWMAMFIDWVVREIFYVLRYKGHKWEHFAQKS